MPVLFQTTIEPDSIGGWQIRLLDTLEQEEIICTSVDQYADEIERMGMDYGGDIEVRWTKSDQITAEQFAEIERQMKKYQDEMENSK